MKADISSGTASVIVAVIGLIEIVTIKFLDDYLKQREREQSREKK